MYDRSNLITACVASVLATAILCSLLAAIAIGNYNLLETREVTEQVRLEGCKTIDDETTRALCLNTNGKK